MLVGVLALQGGFANHVEVLAAIGHEPRLVRSAADLDAIEGLVLPGGESTAQRRLIASAHLAEPLARAVERGAAVLATCAGLILAAAHVRPDRPGFAWLDVAVARNAWGRQVDSFEATDDAGALPLVFIRAPRIVAVGSSVEVLATLGGEPVLVRQRRVVGATFHPELTDDRAVHALAFGAA
jgi:pyridoxal 5'-phosphate synthase pdxT subunit